MELVDAFSRALELRLENRRDEELAVLLAAAEEHEDDHLWLEIAHWYAGRGLRRPDALAATDFAEADKWSELALTKAGLAGLHARRGEVEKAEVLIDAALKLDAEIAEAYAVRGEIRSRQGRRDEAIAQLEQALKLDPRCARAYVLLAEIAAADGLTEGVNKILDLGATQCHDDDVLLVALSARYDAEGDRERAVRALTQAVEMNAENAEAWRRLAKFAAAEQDGDRLRDAMERAMALDRDATLAWIAIERLTLPELDVFGK